MGGMISCCEHERAKPLIDLDSKLNMQEFAFPNGYEERETIDYFIKNWEIKTDQEQAYDHKVKDGQKNKRSVKQKIESNIKQNEANQDAKSPIGLNLQTQHFPGNVSQRSSGLLLDKMRGQFSNVLVNQYFEEDQFDGVKTPDKQGVVNKKASFNRMTFQKKRSSMGMATLNTLHSQGRKSESDKILILNNDQENPIAATLGQGLFGKGNSNNLNNGGLDIKNNSKMKNLQYDNKIEELKEEEYSQSQLHMEDDIHQHTSNSQTPLTTE